MFRLSGTPPLSKGRCPEGGEDGVLYLLSIQFRGLISSPPSASRPPPLVKVRSFDFVKTYDVRWGSMLLFFLNFLIATINVPLCGTPPLSKGRCPEGGGDCFLKSALHSVSRSDIIPSVRFASTSPFQGEEFWLCQNIRCSLRLDVIFLNFLFSANNVPLQRNSST